MTKTADPWQRPAWTPEPTDHPARGQIGLKGLPGVFLHRLVSEKWPGPPIRIAVLADPHVCDPWMPVTIVQQIVDKIQDIGADLILLAGDYLPDRYMPCRHPDAETIVPLFTSLTAPLGVFAVMGNHDYLDCPVAQATDGKESSIRAAFAGTGVRMMGNEATQLCFGETIFWLVTLDSQRGRGKDMPGYDDAEAAFASVPEGAPAILLAHEPDYFAQGDSRPVLQISGHTHGGQFVLFGRRPMTPSNFGDRYAIGHIVEDGRDLIVSAGLGYSGLPLRFGVPPEITLIELSSTETGRKST